MTAPAAGAAARHAPVTVLGLGLMGSAIACAFQARGHPTTVWNRSPEKTGPLTAMGARSVATAAEAFSAGPLAVICVKDHAAVHAVIEQAGDALSDRVLVDLSSGSSQDAAETVRRAAARGARCLDGAILSTPEGIGMSATTVLYSGPRALFDAHEHTLSALGGHPLYLGEDEGLASLHEVALLGTMWASLNGFLHATALVGSAGVEAETFAPFAEMLFGSMGTFISRYARQVTRGDYTADDSTMDTHLAATAHLIRESASRGVDGTLPRHLRAVMAEVVARGHAADSYASVTEYFAKPSTQPKADRRRRPSRGAAPGEAGA